MNNGLQSEMGAVARACLAFGVSTFTNKKYYIYISHTGLYFHWIIM